MRSGRIDHSKQANAWCFIFLLAGQEVANVHAVRQFGQALLQETDALAQVEPSSTNCVRQLSGCQPAEFCEGRKSTAGLTCKRKMGFRTDLEVAQRFVDSTSQLLALSGNIDGKSPPGPKLQKAITVMNRCMEAATSANTNTEEKPLLRSLIVAWETRTAADYHNTVSQAASERGLTTTDFDSSKYSTELSALESVMLKMDTLSSKYEGPFGAHLPVEDRIDLRGMLHEIISNKNQNISAGEFLSRHSQLNETEIDDLVSQAMTLQKVIEEPCNVTSLDSCKVKEYRKVLKSLAKVDDEELEVTEELTTRSSLLQTRSAMTIWKRIYMGMCVTLMFICLGTLFGLLATLAWPVVAVMFVIMAVFAVIGAVAGISVFEIMHPKYDEMRKRVRQERWERRNGRSAQLPEGYPPIDRRLGEVPEGYPPAQSRPQLGELPDGHPPTRDDSFD